MNRLLLSPLRDATSLSEGGLGKTESFAFSPKAPSLRELTPKAAEGVFFYFLSGQWVPGRGSCASRTSCGGFCIC